MPVFTACRTFWGRVSAINRARKLRRGKARLQQARIEIDRLARDHALIVAGYGAAIQGLSQGLLQQEAQLTALTAGHARTLASVQRLLARLAALPGERHFDLDHDRDPDDEHGISPRPDNGPEPGTEAAHGPFGVGDHARHLAGSP